MKQGEAQETVNDPLFFGGFWEVGVEGVAESMQRKCGMCAEKQYKTKEKV